MLEEVLANNWVHAWVLSDIGALPRPISYAHSSGATIFANLDAAARDALAAMTSTTTHVPLRHPVAAPAVKARPASEDVGAGYQDGPIFFFRPEKASARGRPVEACFEILAGSTAMKHGSPTVKRDRFERDRLVRLGILVPHDDPDLYVFAQDHVCNSPSQAAGIIKDGNASGAQLWRDPSTGRTLKAFLDGPMAEVGPLMPTETPTVKRKRVHKRPEDRWFGAKAK